MSPLEAKIRRQIELEGPMAIAEYWNHCLFDPKHGYYTTKVPIGAGGDFTTAPEISQMFGEMLAAWWLATIRLNNVEPALVEIGPGRGTLMADVLRTLGKLDPLLKERLQVHMVEVSPRLTALQKERLADSGFSISWHETIAALPHVSLGILANELFDAIPMKAFVKHDGAWLEDAISVDADGKLFFTAKPANLDPAILPDGHQAQPDGAVFEYAPAREALMLQIAERLAKKPGFGLFVDYGHATPGFGDTLQAMRHHAYAPVQEHPGEADITSHVDFQSLRTAASAGGLVPSRVVTQGDFLRELGIAERAKRLSDSQPQLRDSIETAIERLVSREQMGSLFKVLGVAHPSLTLPALKMVG